MNDRMKGETRAAYTAAQLFLVIGSMTDTVVRIAKDSGSEDFKLASQLLGSYGEPGASRFYASNLSDDVTPAIRELYERLEKIGDHIDALVSLGDTVDAIITTIPRDRDGITASVAAAQAEYERAANAVLGAAVLYGDEAVSGPQIKAEIVAELMKPVGEKDGLSRTAAEKAASEHPRYREHRERLNTLQQQKSEREDARTIAYTRLETARMIGDVVEHQIRAAEQIAERFNITAPSR